LSFKFDFVFSEDKENVLHVNASTNNKEASCNTVFNTTFIASECKKKLVEAMARHNFFDSNSIARKCLKVEPLKGPYDNL